MNLKECRLKAVISNVSPQIEEGQFAIKRIIGDQVTVSADIFTDGHHAVAANLLFRHLDETHWQEVPMLMEVNDRWSGNFRVERLGVYFYTIQAWVDYFRSWQNDLAKKFHSGMDIQIEMKIGVSFLEKILKNNTQVKIKHFLTEIKKIDKIEDQVELATNEELSLLVRNLYPNNYWMTQFHKKLSVTVDRPKALFSTWYEIFPRSFGSKPNQHGTFKDVEKLLPEIAQMGFDVLYFPPIHPIGYSKRKGKGNQLKARSNDPGSPWAIGSHEGGHKSIHPKLGSFADFEDLVTAAEKFGIEIALDIALQCSLDHPYIKEHPDWFSWRPDGTIQYAENPPKKYEDIVPFFFETKDWKALWKELRSIFIFWIEKGVTLFRVDNPHTKPFAFWEWLITTIKHDYPDVIFLSEAFTRPKVMHWLSKLGFSQSYTYFTWRHTKQELIEYFSEIVLSDLKEFFRPNLWTNTPDILTEELQKGGRAAFISRLILAATLSSNYGIYAPAYELMEARANRGTEEYYQSEKYQLKHWNIGSKKSLKKIITQMNHIRKNYEAFQQTSHLQFLEIDNQQILYYGKFLTHSAQAFLILVNLDPYHPQSGKLIVPLQELGLAKQGSFAVHELFSNRSFIWEGERQTVTLDPHMPANIFHVEKKLKKEWDFDYFF